MSMVTCYECSLEFSDKEPVCPHCGSPRRTYMDFGQVEDNSPSAQMTSESQIAEYPFFPVSSSKFLWMSILSLVYPYYWIYKTWERINARSDEWAKVSPFWRTVFCLFFNFNLYSRIREYHLEKGGSVSWSAGWLASLFFVLESMGSRMPWPVYLVGFLSFLPIIPVLNTTLEANKRVQSLEDGNSTFSAANVAWIFVGLVIWILALVPEQVT